MIIYRASGEMCTFTIHLAAGEKYFLLPGKIYSQKHPECNTCNVRYTTGEINAPSFPERYPLIYEETHCRSMPLCFTELTFK